MLNSVQKWLVRSGDTPAPGEEAIPSTEREAIEGVLGLMRAADPAGFEPAPGSLGKYFPGRFTVRRALEIPAAYRSRLGDVREADLRVGVFATPGAVFEAAVQTGASWNPIAPQWQPTVRTAGCKLFGVPGEKLVADGREAFDFCFFKSPVLFVGTASDLLRYAAARTYFGAGFLGQLSYFAGRPRGLLGLAASRGQARSLGESCWYSATPYLLGRWPDEPRLTPALRGRARAVKYRLKGDARDAGGDVAARFDVGVQLQVSPGAQPVEDASVRWSERLSPWVSLGMLELLPTPTQPGPFGAHRVPANLTFDPWHCTAEHRPLGGFNRTWRRTARVVQEIRFVQRQWVR